MKKFIFIILFICSSINVFAQIEFEKGYYINNNGQKIECLIKNFDWLNNPKEIQYQIENSSEVKILSTSNIKEFSIDGVSQYVRTTVLVDRSSDLIGELDHSKEPILKKEQLLLKVLVLGKGNLYQYRENDLLRFFFNYNQSDIEQLIYKRYWVSDTQISKNSSYKQKLWNSLKCPTITTNDLEKLKYNAKKLTSIFIKYNECENSLISNFNKYKTKDLFHLNFRPGVNLGFNHMKFGDKNNHQSYDKKSATGFRIGFEAESVLSFNKNKWALLIEPTYQQVSYDSRPVGQLVKFRFKSFELPLGIRHYFFLKKKTTKLFLNVLYVANFPFESSINFELNENLKIKGNNYLALGFGFNYNNKLSAEVRHGVNREILEINPSWISNYRTLSFIIGYSLF